MPKNLTVSISDDLAEKMDKLKDVNWSWICEMAIDQKGYWSQFKQKKF